MPGIAATLDSVFDDPTSLVGATVLFRMRRRGDTTPTVSSNATVLDTAAAIVTYNWQSTDTLSVGLYDAEFVVTYANGTQRTFPNNEYQTVEVVSNLS